MTQRQETGKVGERAAANYLVGKQYEIIARNVRHASGDEIDIIARSREGVLVFAEVKTMRSGGLRPEDNLHRAKLARLQRSAQFYANRHPEQVGESGWRIDLIAVSLNNNLTDMSSDCSVQHYENI